MGFFSDLFGGGEDPKVVSQPAGSAGQMYLLNSLIGNVQGLLGAPGFQPGIPSVPAIGGLTQQQQAIGGQIAPSVVGSFQQGQDVFGRMADPAQNMKYAQQMFQPIQDAIANRFASVDGARSSGFGQALGRGFAQGVMPQIFNQQAQGASGLTQGAMGGLGMSNQISQQAEQLNQMFAQGARADALQAYPGMDPRLQQWLPIATGSPTLTTMGLPGSQSNAGGGLMGMGGAMIGMSKLLPLLGMSDRRVKKNIRPISGALDKLSRIKGYSFNYIGSKDSNRNGGVMAQDLEKVLPDAVSEINGVKFVRYDAVTGLLVEAVKELRDQINEIRSE